MTRHAGCRVQIAKNDMQPAVYALIRPSIRFSGLDRVRADSVRIRLPMRGYVRSDSPT